MASCTSLNVGDSTSTKSENTALVCLVSNIAIANSTHRSQPGKKKGERRGAGAGAEQEVEDPSDVR